MIHIGMEYFDFLDATIQPRLLVDNEYAFAFLSYMPIVAGHTLICPKRAVSRFDQLKDFELQSVIHLKDILHTALTIVFEAEGFNYAWNE
jgi:diadenosine tetraphosphate (Ap4A) HIT family hydrolase